MPSENELLEHFLASENKNIHEPIKITPEDQERLRTYADNKPDLDALRAEIEGKFKQPKSMDADSEMARQEAFSKTEGGSWDEVFDAGRDSVIFPPLSEFRDKFREMICEGDFDFTQIFEEIQFEGETYTDISNEGADALADYFLNLFEMIDEWRSEQVGYKKIEKMNNPDSGSHIRV